MKKVKQLRSAREEYLYHVKRQKLFIRLSQVSIFILLVATWEILANAEVIDSFITSKPSSIITKFVSLLSDGLMTHVGITCYETMIGFFLGTIIGTLLAAILWWSPFLSKVFSPYLVVLNSLPKVALGPIIIVWVGAGTPAIITMALAISLVVTILDMLSGFVDTDVHKIRMLQSFGANKLQTFVKIVLPSNVPTLLNVLKVNIGLSMVGVITGEFLVSKNGLGYLIVYGGQVFQLDLVMTSVIILGIVATLMYNTVILFEKLISKSGKWQ